MPGQYSFRHWGPNHPAIQEMAAAAVSEEVERRADANETTLVSAALTQAGIAAIEHDYPDLMFRRIAPLQEGIGPGAEHYTWEEIQAVGMAAIITNYADDLPDVAQYITTNTGHIKSLGNSFQYTKQDIRRVVEARKQGRGATLDVERIALARQMMERKKDYIAAFGDSANNLPGVLKNANVTLLTAAAPASGTSKKWTGVDKTGAEMLVDLRRGLKQVRTQSQGVHTATLIVAPIEEVEALSTKPLVGSTENQITVLQHFLRSQAELQSPVRILGWNRAAIADAAGTGPRVMFLQASPDVLRLVEPLDFEADAPQRVSLTFKVPCESRFGSIFFKKPLGAVYMDFV